MKPNFFHIKWRTMHAWGYSPWNYSTLEPSEGESKKEKESRYLNEIAERFNWSDKYRDIEHKRITKNQLPNEFVKQQIEHYQRTIENYNRYLNYYSQISKNN